MTTTNNSGIKIPPSVFFPMIVTLCLIIGGMHTAWDREELGQIRNEIKLVSDEVKTLAVEAKADRAEAKEARLVMHETLSFMKGYLEVRNQ